MTIHGNNPDEDATTPGGGDAPLSERLKVEGDADTAELDVDSIPVQGDEATANELVEEAYGDKDNDGNPDLPNAPFPG